MTAQTLSLLSDLLRHAKQAGADAAEAIHVSSISVGAGVRNGVTEELERSETTDMGLRVFIGCKSATVSTSTVEPARFEQLAAQAMAMARVLPDDRYAGLAPQAMTTPCIDNALQLNDPSEPDTATLLARAGWARMRHWP